MLLKNLKMRDIRVKNTTINSRGEIMLLSENMMFIVSGNYIR
jgi:hypothetical protein